MKKKLVIDVASLPEEGKVYSDSLDASVLLFPEENIKAVGSLDYDLFVQTFENELLVRGSIQAPMEFVCVRTLQPFVQTIHAENFDISMEVENSQVDLTNHLTQELVLLFPDYPRCDEADEPMDCDIDSRYLAVDKTHPDGVMTPRRDGEPNPWDALDGFQSS